MYILTIIIFKAQVLLSHHPEELPNKEASSKRGGLGGGSSCFFENFLDFSDIITIFWGDLNLCPGQLLNPGAHVYDL